MEQNQQQEQQEQQQDIQDINNLSNFEFKNQSLEIQTLNEKSKKLKEDLLDINSYISKIDNGGSITEIDKKKLVKLLDKQKIYKELTQMDIERDILIEQARIAISSIYDGQLIEGFLTSRNGNLYKFRKRSPANFSKILRLISEHKEEVISKLNKEQSEKLAYLFNFAVEMGIDSTLRKSRIYRDAEDFPTYTEITSVKKPISEMRFCIPDNSLYGTYNVARVILEDFVINYIELSSSGIVLLNSNSAEQNLPYYLENYIIFSNENLIEQMKEEAKVKIEQEKQKLVKFKTEIESRFAKALLYKKFKDTHKNEGEY